MQLRASLFWDTDIQTIDFQQHKASIIERIVMRGRWEAFKIMLAFYGKEVVKQVLLDARYLDKYSLAFCSTIFHTPINQFRCYKLAVEPNTLGLLKQLRKQLRDTNWTNFHE
jgi:hypothetical protein